MAKIKETNEHFREKNRRSAMLRREVIESSIFEGIYNVTEQDIEAHTKANEKLPRRKTA